MNKRIPRDSNLLLEGKRKACDMKTPKIVSVSELLGSHSEVHLSHNGQIYRLRVTRQDKLILTK